MLYYELQMKTLTKEFEAMVDLFSQNHVYNSSNEKCCFRKYKIRCHNLKATVIILQSSEKFSKICRNYSRLETFSQATLHVK